MDWPVRKVVSSLTESCCRANILRIYLSEPKHSGPLLLSQLVVCLTLAEIPVMGPVVGHSSLELGKICIA